MIDFVVVVAFGILVRKKTTKTKRQVMEEVEWRAFKCLFFSPSWVVCTHTHARIYIHM